jgi:hypothetical protein
MRETVETIAITLIWLVLMAPMILWPVLSLIVRA